MLDRAVQRRMADGMTYEKAYEDARITIQAPGYSEHHTGMAIDMNVYTTAGVSYSLATAGDTDPIYTSISARRKPTHGCRSTPQNTALSSATPKARRASPASITSRGITATSARSTRSA